MKINAEFNKIPESRGLKITKKMNPMLREENRDKLIKEAMKAISDKQAQVLNEADKIIENVAVFEKNVHKQFILNFIKQ